MAIIKVDYGTVGGGQNDPVLDSFTASTTPKTYNTKNATVAMNGGGANVAIINGKKEVLDNQYPSLYIIDYDESTNVLSVSGATGTSYPTKVYYEPMN